MIKHRKAYVKKRKTTPNNYGSQVTNYEDLGIVRGVLDFLTIEKGEIAHKIVEDSTHMFICETRLDIEQGDKFVVNEVEYEVNFVDRPRMGRLAQIELKQLMQQNSMMDLFVYYGVSELDYLIETDILLLDKEQIKSRAFSKEIEVVDGNLFIVYPKSLGKASIRVNNRPVTDWRISELMIGGYIHYVYVTEVTGRTAHIELF